ncbi:hypothetical protein PENTCL1PPCAC_24677, partial [Pristionchus entomophagus]
RWSSLCLMRRPFTLNGHKLKMKTNYPVPPSSPRTIAMTSSSAVATTECTRIERDWERSQRTEGVCA